MHRILPCTHGEMDVTKDFTVVLLQQRTPAHTQHSRSNCLCDSDACGACLMRASLSAAALHQTSAALHQKQINRSGSGCSAAAGSASHTLRNRKDCTADPAGHSETTVRMGKQLTLLILDLCVRYAELSDSQGVKSTTNFLQALPCRPPRVIDRSTRSEREQLLACSL